MLAVGFGRRIPGGRRPWNPILEGPECHHHSLDFIWEAERETI